MIHFRKCLLAFLFVWLLSGASVPAPQAKQRTTVQDLIQFTWSLSPEDPFSKENAVGAAPKAFNRGETFFLTLTGTPKEGYHTYPLTKKTESQSGGNSTLSYSGDAFTPLWPVVESEPVAVDEGPDAGGVNLE